MIYKLYAIPWKSPMILFIKTENNPNIDIKHKRPQITNTKSWAKMQSLNYHNTWLQITLQRHSNWNSMVPGHTHIGQWSRMEDQLISSTHSFSHLTLNKCAKNINRRKDSYFNNWCLENRIGTCRRLKVDPYLSHCIKINSRWIKSVTIEPRNY